MIVKHYVAGLLVDVNSPNRGSVLLILKKRPDWQRGRLNLIGGKVEPGETSRQAMAREFYEETGYPNHEFDWRPFCQLRHPSKDGFVTFYVAHRDDRRNPPTTVTDESIHWVPIASFQAYAGQCIGNLAWLVPLALSKHEEFADVVDNSAN
jgi:8-oxo-dGTP diphosphatase